MNSILAEIDQIKEKTANWDDLSQKEQDRIIDKNFVPREVRKQYAEKNSTREWGNFFFKFPKKNFKNFFKEIFRKLSKQFSKEFLKNF